MSELLSAALVLFGIVGSSGIKDRKLSNSLLKSSTFILGSFIFLIFMGSKLNNLAPLTPKLASLTFQTDAGELW